MKTRLKKYRVDLEKRIKAIISHFRFTQKLTGITPAQEDKLRGLIALCHAELEDYFETVALTIFQDSVDLWTHNKTPNYIVTSLFLLGEHPNKNLDPGTMSVKIQDSYKYNVRHNHGLKPKNIHTLFYPLGYEDSEFDSSFLAQLNSLGVQRGSIVHTSAKKATQALDQQTVVNMIQDIVNLLPDFESVIFSKLT